MLRFLRREVKPFPRSILSLLARRKIEKKNRDKLWLITLLLLFPKRGLPSSRLNTGNKENAL